MVPTKSEQLLITDLVIDAACKIGNVDYCTFIKRKRGHHINALRGVSCVIVREKLVHPQVAAYLFRRDRSNVCNLQKKYLGYLQVKDKTITDLYNRIKQEFQLLYEKKL